jgi:hypothetical protein
MMFLILSLLMAATTSQEVIATYENAIFARTNCTIRITRTHFDSENQEIYHEFIYKQGCKIRIDTECENSTIRTFVYDGENGFYDGQQITKLSSLEMILFGCTCGYLDAMQRFKRSYYDDSDIILISGRQGNSLYLDARTQLPIRYELKNVVVEFTEYDRIEGFGHMPFMIATMNTEGTLSITRITSVSKQKDLPVGFFNTSEQNKAITLD